MIIYYETDYIMHHGIKGQKWGVRRFQNKDGTLTDAGKRRAKNNKLEKQVMSKSKLIMSRKDHYLRNQLNVDLPKTVDDAAKQGWTTLIANAHQFTKEGSKNIKYVDPTGKLEAVYDKFGKLITNPLDMGSYNYSPSTKTKRGHFKNDILPWILYGNTPDDPSRKRQRMLAIANVYTKKMKDLSKTNPLDIIKEYDTKVKVKTLSKI